MTDQEMISSIVPVLQDPQKVLLILQASILNNLGTMDTATLVKIMTVLNIPQT